MVLSAVSCLHQLSYVGANATGYSSVQDVIRLQDQWVHRHQVLAVFLFPDMFLRQWAGNGQAMDGPKKEKKITVRDRQGL